MEAHMEDEHIIRSFSLPRSLFAQLQKLANQRTNGNRSAIAKDLLLKGLEAERQEPPPRPEAA